ncbi:hypothetical protein BOX15_Mlig033276g2, partial [Macrostomum lignano]
RRLPMTSRSVLPYVRGIDLSETNAGSYRRSRRRQHQPDAAADADGQEVDAAVEDEDPADGDLPAGVDRLVRLEWLFANSAGLRVVPDRIGKLQRLEHLSVNRNRLTHLHGELCTVASLKSLHARHNAITAGGIPDTLFQTADMQVVDLSHNRLRSFPTALEGSRSLMVLNLSHNRIEQVPVDLFVNCTDLMYLDLSHNALQQIPAQLRRCINLRKLVLSQNPEMSHSQLRSIMALKQLEMLHLANTGRTLNNFPESLEKLSRLVDLDLSSNDLPVVPEALYQLRSLRRLSLSSTGLSSLDTMSNSWPQLEVLDVSENKLEQLPAALCKLASLRKLYISDNRLSFAGMPKSIGKLERLVVLNAANNLLENIPEGLCRCGQLRRLYLSNNRLVTLPDAIHYLKETLDVFDVANNPDLVLPPKPKEIQIGAGKAFYNLDFSLETHKKAALLRSGSPLAGEQATQAAAAAAAPGHAKRDQAARWRRLKRRGRDSGSESGAGASGDDTSSRKVLDGMRKVARAKQTQQFEAQSVKSRSWKDSLRKPDLDYSEIFDELVGQIPGLEVWEIDDRYPQPVEKDLIGVFFRGDCYVVLNTFQAQNGSLDWAIYYWIGSSATTDKLFCASMHAVNLRNLLGAECRTQREEEDGESPEFLALFGGSIQIVDGEHSNSGLFQVIEEQPPCRLYRLCGAQTVRLQAVSLSPDELDPKFVYLLDAQTMLFVWVGASAKHMTASKARLIADRIRKNERKNAAEVVSTMEGFEPVEFWTALGCEKPAREEAVDHIPADWEPSRPLLYAVRMGPGTLEIPRIRGQLTQSVLESTGVYLLDCGTDIFVWFGGKAVKFLRYAGLKLAQEAFTLFDRSPETTAVTRCLESAEPIAFKLRFHGWDDAVAVDFTRTAESVAKRGTDMRTIMERDKMRMDLTDFFLPRPTPPTAEEFADQMANFRDDVDNLETLANFVLVPNYRAIKSAEKYKRIAPDELGHFYSKECYIFICHYYPEEPEEDPEQPKDEEEEEEEIQMKYIVYFWQGRDTSELALHKFNFDTRKTLAEKIKDPEFRPMRQQEESREFLALLNRKFIVHKGPRPRTPQDLEKWRAAEVTRLYQLRTPNADPMLSRCLEVPAAAASLCSAFCHLLTRGPDRLLVWRGRGSSQTDRELALELATSLLPDATPAEMTEGEETDEFWELLGGRAAYFTGVDFYSACRLFKITTEEGYLKADDLGVDFAQSALTDSAIMLLDTGVKLYLWIGTKVSDVLKKLALQAAKLYLLAVRDREGASGTRRLGAAQKGSEPPDFTVCFHAWGEHKAVKDWRG